jgi:alanine racemase
MLSPQRADEGLLLVSTSSDIHGSVLSDTVVQKNCTLHVRGNLLGDLTIEPGAKVIVEGSVDGRIVNKGGRLTVNNKGLAACVMLDGPPEAEACGVLKVNLTALAANYETLTKRTEAECAGVVKANAYGCGIEPIAGALARSGCKTFFVSNLPEARRVRAVAPHAIIYVLHGLYSGGGPAFAEVDARPVINSSIELAEWDVFVGSRRWTGGCALNVDTGETRLGLSMEEAAAFAPRVQTLGHDIALLMSRFDHPDKPGHPGHARQLDRFRDLRRLYAGIPSSIANATAVCSGAKADFDLVRTGSALYGVNPAPGSANPMTGVIELRARIVQVRSLAAGETIAGDRKGPAKRRMRLALASIGYADGYPRAVSAAEHKLHVLVGGHRCPVAGPPTMDLLPIDVTDLPDPAAARYGEMVTIIGTGLGVGIDDLAAGAKMSGRDVLIGLGSRFHRVYYAI